MRSREMSKAFALVDRLDIEERGTRESLLRKARAGDVGALLFLHEHYNLRLPLVEAQLGLQLPLAGPARPSGEAHGVPDPPRNDAIATSRLVGPMGFATDRSDAAEDSHQQSTARAHAVRARARRRRTPRSRGRSRGRTRGRRIRW